MTPRLNFDEIDHGNEDRCEVIPKPGWYRCRIVKVYDNDRYWKLELQHLDRPPFLIQDFLHFSQKAWSRVKALYFALGLSTSGSVDCQPSDLEGREVSVLLKPDTYRGRAEMKVDFDGYKPVKDHTRLSAEFAGQNEDPTGEPLF
jgi:hypothetical protein